MSFKRELEDAFLQATGLAGRRQVSAIYSMPQKSPLLWLNLNPGGDEKTAVILSDEELAQGRHEYFDGHGITSQETAQCLQELFPDQPASWRSVQGSNVAWRRSPNADGIDIGAARETAPFLKRYIQYIAPEMILFGGIKSYTTFVRAHQPTVTDYGGVIKGRYRGRDVRLLLRANLTISGIGTIRSAAILHPSKRRWREILKPLRETVNGLELPPPIMTSQQG